MYEPIVVEESENIKELGIDKKHKKAFYKIAEFPKMITFEENFPQIKEELLRLIQDSNIDKDFFEPWCEKDLYEESNPDGWIVAPLIINGNFVKNNMNRVPFLENLLRKTKGIVSASFSCIKPNTWIVPHKGYENYSDKVLRYHLGIIIPKGDVGLRVNKIQTKWIEGKSIIFDDGLTHEAWNYTEQDRIVLIIDFLRNDNLNLSLIELPDLMLTDQAKSYIQFNK